MKICTALSFIIIAGLSVAEASNNDGSTTVKIGVLPFPEHGHMNPMLPILEEIIQRGHNVEVYSPALVKEKFFKNGVIGGSGDEGEKKARGGDFTFKSISLVDMSDKELITALADWYRNNLLHVPATSTLPIIQDQLNQVLISPMMAEMKKLMESIPGRDRPDVLFVDQALATAGVAVAELFKIPVVTFWPLTLQIPGQLNPAFPALSTGYSLEMSTKEWIGNYVSQRLAVRELSRQQAWNNNLRVSILGDEAPLQESYDELFSKYPMITPSVFGLDMAQPLCPNIFPVGFLLQQGKGQEDSSNGKEKVEDDQKELDEWLSGPGCKDGIVFYNFGTVATVLSDSMLNAMGNAILDSIVEDIAAEEGDEKVSHCHLWKLPGGLENTQLGANTELISQLRDAVEYETGKVKIISWLPTNPKDSVLNHPNTKVFVTHCGASGVYEAVDTLVPMVGIPLFADQADVCARIADAGFGEVIPDGKLSLTADQLKSAVSRIMRNSIEIKNRMKPVQALGHSMGGAKKAVDILEMAAYPWFQESVQCGNQAPANRLSWIQKNDFDVLFVTAFLLLLPGLSMWSCCCSGSSGRRGGAKLKRD